MILCMCGLRELSLIPHNYYSTINIVHWGSIIETFAEVWVIPFLRLNIDQSTYLVLLEVTIPHFGRRYAKKSIEALLLAE